MDIGDGVFTSGHPGSYTVTWSFHTGYDVGEHYVDIYLRTNEVNIPESRHVSYYTGSSGRLLDQGGRTMVLHLDRGDTLDLLRSSCAAQISYVTFCFFTLSV